MSKPASLAQVRYITSLSRRLAKFVDDESIADGIDDAAEDTSLTSYEAHQLISTLIKTVELVKNDESLGDRVSRIVNGYSDDNGFDGFDDGDVADPFEAETDRQLAQHAIDAAGRNREESAYYAAQVEQLGGDTKPAPAAMDGYVRVWKARPNQLSRHWYDDPIHYGWAWECRHPQHQGRTVKGRSSKGWVTTMEGARKHVARFHWDECNRDMDWDRYRDRRGERDY